MERKIESISKSRKYSAVSENVINDEALESTKWSVEEIIRQTDRENQYNSRASSPFETVILDNIEDTLKSKIFEEEDSS